MKSALHSYNIFFRSSLAESDEEYYFFAQNQQSLDSYILFHPSLPSNSVPALEFYISSYSQYKDFSSKYIVSRFNQAQCINELKHT
jgi:hypothetical protein